MKFISTVLATVIFGCIPSTLAANCNASAYLSCKIKDNRDEFKSFYDRPCQDFEKNVKIQRNKKYSGQNKNGYPQIKVEYKFKVCNDNDEPRKKIKLEASQTSAMIDNAKIPGLKSGAIAGGKCRKYDFLTTVDSEKRYHSASIKLNGFLFKGGKIFNGVGQNLVKCSASEKFESRFEYDDDCGVQVKSKCVLKGTTAKCAGNILRTSDTDCRDVDVEYRFKICNYDNEKVKLKGATSNIKIGKKIYKKLPPFLPKNKCYTVKADDVIKTCEPEKTETGISVSARGQGKFKECRDYSFLKIEVGDAYPSASPTSAPTISSQPSGSPSVSHQPSLSIAPTDHPSSSPTVFPTMHPSSSPSASPTKTVSPSSGPSPLPTKSPSRRPSASPSEKPTISSKPSAKPSASPTVSAMPSCAPSASPTESTAPSKKPTAFPTRNPTAYPTSSPSKSSEPTSVPIVPILAKSADGGQPTRSLYRKRFLKSKKSYKSDKGHKAKSTKYKAFNICQD